MLGEFGATDLTSAEVPASLSHHFCANADKQTRQTALGLPWEFFKLENLLKVSLGMTERAGRTCRDSGAKLRTMDVTGRGSYRGTLWIREGNPFVKNLSK